MVHAADQELTENGGSVMVTGAMGCVGAWTVRELVLRGLDVVAFDRSTDRRRLRLVLSDEELQRVTFVAGDLVELDSLDDAVKSENVTRIIHLGALQLPFCKADPPRGAMVNVVGTVNVFEAARRNGISHVAYTSSIAVFSMPGGRLAKEATATPNSHYGVFKLANEGTARAYWHDSGISNIGLRPLTIYGPGRDQGMTSSPTKAIIAAVLGYPYEISFGGSTLFHYAPDVAHALIEAAFADRPGAEIYNLNGTRASIAQFVSVIEEAVDDAAGLIRFRENPLPFPDDIDVTGLEAIGPPAVTTLKEGIRASAELFQSLHDRGGLIPKEHGLEIVANSAIDYLPPS
jgi:nucleoside-diphosphate-sugar epimerase